MSRLIFNQLSTTPSDTDAGSSQLYLKDNGGLYLKNASNTEVALLTGTSPFPTVSSGRLDVHGDVNFGVDGTGALQQESTTVRLKHTSTGEVHLMTHDGNEDINLNSAGYIQFETAGTEAMRIDANNKVGIGTTVPSELLSVAGAVSATNVCKAWFNWSHGAGDFHRSYNMSSETDDGTGSYTFAFTTPMDDANYCVVMGSSRNGSSGNAANSIDFHSALVTGFQIRTGNDSGSMVNHEKICVAVFDTA